MLTQASAIQRRSSWISYIETLTGSFGENTEKLTARLRAEVDRGDISVLISHLRLCGAVPEKYGHDSTQEKLYSKYTDSVVSESLSAIGLQSVVVGARAGVADVQARGRSFSLVADAKAFRLSRTAKNQKDFKIQALDGWRNNLDYAVLVSPIYQFPTRTSQIYHQAIARNVCIISYSHLAVLVALGLRQDTNRAASALHEILKTVATLHLSKNAVDHWTGINQSLVKSLDNDADLWTTEKTTSIEYLEAVKQESLIYLQEERNRLLGLSHQEAVAALIRASRIDSRVEQVRNIEHSGLLGAETNE